MVGDDPIAPLVTKAMETAVWLHGGLDTIVNETLKQFSQAQGLARKHAVPAIFGAGGNGDPRKSFGDWLLACARNDGRYLEKHYGSSFVAVIGHDPG